jgi:hypothetical protein
MAVFYGKDIVGFLRAKKKTDTWKRRMHIFVSF